MKRTYYGLFSGLAVITVAADMLTKRLATANFKDPMWLLGESVGLVFRENYGIAFSIPFKGTALIVTNLVILAVLFYLSHKSLRKNAMWEVVAFALLIGGAIGNIFDRIVHGYVIDFIAVGAFPVFNIADIALTVGAAILAVILLKEK